MPPETATTLVKTAGQIRTSDGPFAETKEVLGGFDLIEVENLDAALEWARKCPARTGSSRCTRCSTSRRWAEPASRSPGGDHVAMNRRAARTSPVAAAFADHWPTVVARLARRYGDLSLAEECAAEAFAEAAVRWQQQPVREPGAWLWTVAQRRAVDRIRHDTQFARRLPLLAPEERGTAVADDPVTDHLALLFGCCHPALSRESQVALTLRAVNGLSLAQIAGVLHTSPDTLTRRLTRARTKLRANAVPFTIPAPEHWGGAAGAGSGGDPADLHRRAGQPWRSVADPRRPVRGGPLARVIGRAGRP
ncbi:MAG: YciI family protein [Propioniciclava sp.]